MKTKSKRILACAMSGLMVAGAFAGCSQADTGTTTAAEQAKQTTAAQKEETTEEVTEALPETVSHDETVTLTVFCGLGGYRGIQPGWMGQILEEKFNVKFDYVLDYERIQLFLMNQQDLGDIVVWGDYDEDYQTAIDKGLLLDLNKDNLLENYGSFIKANLTASLDDNMARSGGVCYGFSGNNALENSVDYYDGTFIRWDVRWDLYNELGQRAVADYDDLLQLMIDMKALCPTDSEGNETFALPIHSEFDDYYLTNAVLLAKAYAGVDFKDYAVYSGITGEYSNILAEDGPYYEALRFLNALYRNGLINADAKDLNYLDVKDQLLAGRYLMSTVYYLGGDVYNTDEHIADNKMMLPIMPSDARGIVYCDKTVGDGGVFSISAKTEHKELCMEILNWLATPEGTLTIIYGPRGICWDVDADGKLYLTDTGRACRNDMNTEITYNGVTYPFREGLLMINNNIWKYSSLIPSDTLDLNLAAGNTFYCESWDNEQGAASCDLEESWRTYSGCKNSEEFILKNDNTVYIPYSGYIAVPDSDVLASKYETVGMIIADGSWECVYADSEKKFEKLFDKMTADAYAAGLQECYEYCIDNVE
ncbi:MAG: extracellular solute-binding protein [Lachnospiraceae bacterium]|nr:extracellular solute-binding protein [Lachnospiraceae bacterium]